MTTPRKSRKSKQNQEAPGHRPFWEVKNLDEMSRGEWEALCDRCGLCCLLKVEDEDTGDIYLTRLACKLLDTHSCSCKDYENRKKKVPDCIRITPDMIDALPWLPYSCAYRALAEGRPLEWWHPLLSGDPETVHSAGISGQGWIRSEKGVKAADIARYIIGQAT